MAQTPVAPLSTSTQDPHYPQAYAFKLIISNQTSFLREQDGKPRLANAITTISSLGKMELKEKIKSITHKGPRLISYHYTFTIFI